MTDFQRPRGTRDFPPEEMEARRRVEASLRNIATTFGFGEVMTPSFENTELFVARSGPGIIEEMYAFEDKGGRKISLRPEITAAVVRYYVNELHTRPKPLKLYYMGNCFRYERPQSGRYREFWQFGAEIIGAQSVEADAEILAFAYYCAEAAGAKVADMRIGHLGVLNSLFDKFDVSEEIRPDIRRFLDKKDFEGLGKFFYQNDLDNDLMDALDRLSKLQGNQEVLEKAQDLLGGECEALDILQNLCEKLESYGVQQQQFSIDLGVARGLDYYTGMVFEIDGVGLGAESQICGGGAYSLSETFGGKDVYSTGFAFGFDRLMLARDAGADEKLRLDAYFIPVSDEARSKCLELLAVLRRNGISADIELLGRKVGKALGYVSSIEAKNAIIIGENELAEGKATVRDMASGNQESVSFDELLAYYLTE